MLRMFLIGSLCALIANANRTSAEESGDPVSRAATRIDDFLSASWDRDAIEPAPESSDSEFCRRLWLDLAGVSPSVYDLRQFLADPSPDKRSRLVDDLLKSQQHARHMASRWIDVLVPFDVQEQIQQTGNIAQLHDWLQQQFLHNMPYDHLVGGFLTAGGASDSGPAVFYTAHDLEPKKLAAATSRIFMGIQIQCAECHNHPTDRWTQEDFWKYAAFFSQLKQSDGSAPGQTIVEDAPGGEVMLPDSDDVMPPRYPGVANPPEPDPENNRRRQLTIWMASRDNPYFARAAVNRVWAQMFGRGLIDPVDAMDAGNPASHPELLDFLAHYFIQQRFDLNDLYAAIARSRAYGCSSAYPQGQSRPPADSFAVMNVKTLTARQFYDSLHQNVFRRRAVTLGDQPNSGVSSRDQFLMRMRTPETNPRDYPHGVVQALGLMNGPEVVRATAANASPLLGALEAPFFDDAQKIETLFLATLSRFPSDQERDRFQQYLTDAKSSADQQAVLEDLLWVLLNTAECAVCP